MVGLNRVDLRNFYDITRKELRSTRSYIKKKISKESELKVSNTFHTRYGLGDTITRYNIMHIEFILNFEKYE